MEFYTVMIMNQLQLYTAIELILNTDTKEFITDAKEFYDSIHRV